MRGIRLVVLFFFFFFFFKEFVQVAWDSIQTRVFVPKFIFYKNCPNSMGFYKILYFSLHRVLPNIMEFCLMQENSTFISHFTELVLIA